MSQINLDWDKVGYKDQAFVLLQPWSYRVMQLRYVKATVGVRTEESFSHIKENAVGTTFSLYELNTIGVENDAPEHIASLKARSKESFLRKYVERLISDGVLQYIGTAAERQK